MMMSTYITIALTIERYISVIYPLLAVRQRSTLFFALLSTPGLIFSMVFTLPNYFLLECKPIHEDYEEEHMLQFMRNESMLAPIEAWEKTPKVQLVWKTWRNNSTFTMVSKAQSSMSKKIISVTLLKLKVDKYVLCFF